MGGGIADKQGERDAQGAKDTDTKAISQQAACAFAFGDRIRTIEQVNDEDSCDGQQKRQYGIHGKLRLRIYCRPLLPCRVRPVSTKPLRT